MFIETQHDMSKQNNDSHGALGGHMQQVQSHHKGNAVGKKTSRSKSFFLIFVLVIVAAGGYWWYKNPTLSLSWNEEKYYGVFLANGDVYFGKLANKESAFITLNDAYYLKVAQISREGKQENIPDLKLIKIGTEFHGPKGSIEFQRGHVLFVQELAASSTVIKVMKGDTTSR